MQRIQLARLLPALALVAALAFAAGCGAGDDDDGGATSGGATTPAAATDAAAPQAPNGVDRAFAQQMVPHHEGAIAMAELAHARARTPFVRTLAGDVARTQGAEIRALRAADRRLARAGVRTGALGLSQAEMGMDHDIAMLRDADDVDRAFVEMMIPHHEGAIAMARVELAKGGDAELRALAREIVDAQQGEIDAMRAQLGEEGIDGGAHSGH